MNFCIDFNTTGIVPYLIIGTKKCFLYTERVQMEIVVLGLKVNYSGIHLKYLNF
jgi:hypothetical protein